MKIPDLFEHPQRLRLSVEVGVGEPDRVGLGVAEGTGVVVEFGQAEDVAGDDFEVGVALLNVDLQRDGDFSAVVGAEAGLEAGGEEVAVAGGEGPERAAKDGAGALAVEARAGSFGADSNSDDLHAFRAALVTAEFLGTDAGTGMDENVRSKLWQNCNVFNAATIFCFDGLSAPPGHIPPHSHYGRRHVKADRPESASLLDCTLEQVRDADFG